MSCYWDLHCWTCDEGAGLSINHGEETISKVAAAAPALTKAAEAMKDIWLIDGFMVSGYSVQWNWFIRHEGHDIAPRNEYGNRADECMKNVECQTCGHVQSCQRPAKHEGPCSTKRGQKE